MPYQAKRPMLWGPGRPPLQLFPGDEVPEPFKAVLLKKHVERVDEVEGKKWADQPFEARQAWAESQGEEISHESYLDEAEEEKKPAERVRKTRNRRVATRAKRMIGTADASPSEASEVPEAPAVSVEAAGPPMALESDPEVDFPEPNSPAPSKRKRGRSRRG